MIVELPGTRSLYKTANNLLHCSYKLLHNKIAITSIYFNDFHFRIRLFHTHTKIFINHCNKVSIIGKKNRPTLELHQGTDFVEKRIQNSHGVSGQTSENQKF